MCEHLEILRRQEGAHREQWEQEETIHQQQKLHIAILRTSIEGLTLGDLEVLLALKTQIRKKKIKRKNFNWLSLYFFSVTFVRNIKVQFRVFPFNMGIEYESDPY